MATVRMSTELRDLIKSNASALFSKRMSEAEEYPPEYLDGDFILDAYLQHDTRVATTLKAMDDLAWTTQTESIRAVLFGTSTRLRFKRNRRMYDAWHNNYSGQKMYIPNGIEALEPLRLKLSEREQRLQALRKEREEFQELVAKVVDSVSTLKQALQVWPGLWELVPPEAKQKHNEVTERRGSTSDPSRPVVDIEKLNTAVVVAKIVEGAI